MRRHLVGTETLAFSPDGRWLAAATRDRVVVLEVSTGSAVFTLSVPVTAECNKSLAFRPDGKRLAVASSREVVVFDTGTQKQVSVCRGHTFVVFGVAFSPDGKQLLSASGDNTVRGWDPETGREIGTIRGHRSGVQCMAISTDGTRVASGGWDRSVKIWGAIQTAQDPVLVNFSSGGGGSLEDLAVSPDRKRIALARRYDSSARDKEGSVEFVDAARGNIVQTWYGHTGNVWGVAFSPSGKRLASISTPYMWSQAPGQPVRWTPGQLKIREVDSGRELWTSEHQFGAPDQDRGGGPRVKFSPDGALVAAPDSHRTLAIWGSESGKKIALLRGHDGRITDLAFSPDGAHIATSSRDGTVRLWDWRTGQERSRMMGHAGPVNTIRFSPDGRLLASASDDRTIRLWGLKGENLAVLRVHTREVECVAFSPDGTRLVSTGGDVLRVWDVSSGEEILTFREGTPFGRSVAFSLDGLVLASINGYTLRIYRVNAREDSLAGNRHNAHEKSTGG
jgi:WD40 repeat protein